MTQIKNAYRTLSKQYHPDNMQAEGNTERFAMINEAYTYLEKLNEMNTATVNTVAATQPVRRAKVIGGAVTAHPGSQEARDKRRSFEMKAKAEEAQKKLKARQEMEERREKIQEEKARRKKEKEILNEIKMIRLAHAIEAMLAPEAKE